MDREKKLPPTIVVALLFILLDALVWLAFGIISAANAHPSIPQADLIRWVMAILALLAAVILLVLFVLLRRRSRIAYWLTLGLLVVISVLTVTDEFGLADLIVLIINVVPLVLLLRERRWVHQPSPTP